MLFKAFLAWNKVNQPCFVTIKFIIFFISSTITTTCKGICFRNALKHLAPIIIAFILTSYISVCMYLYIYICIYIYVYVYILLYYYHLFYVSMYIIYIYIYIYIHICIYLHIFACIYYICINNNS